MFRGMEGILFTGKVVGQGVEGGELKRFVCQASLGPVSLYGQSWLAIMFTHHYEAWIRGKSLTIPSQGSLCRFKCYKTLSPAY